MFEQQIIKSLQAKVAELEAKVEDVPFTVGMYKELTKRHKEIAIEKRDLEAGHTEFNRVIDHACDYLPSSETKDFLQAWREGDWAACREFEFEVNDENNTK